MKKKVFVLVSPSNPPVLDLVVGLLVIKCIAPRDSAAGVYPIFLEPIFGHVLKKNWGMFEGELDLVWFVYILKNNHWVSSPSKIPRRRLVLMVTLFQLPPMNFLLWPECKIPVSCRWPEMGTAQLFVYPIWSNTCHVLGQWRKSFQPHSTFFLLESIRVVCPLGIFEKESLGSVSSFDAVPSTCPVICGCDTAVRRVGFWCILWSIRPMTRIQTRPFAVFQLISSVIVLCLSSGGDWVIFGEFYLGLGDNIYASPGRIHPEWLDGLCAPFSIFFFIASCVKYFCYGNEYNFFFSNDCSSLVVI